MRLDKHEEDIVDVTDMADKELKIENDKREIVDKWFSAELMFKAWKDRGVPNLTGYGLLVDELDEAVMMVQTFLTMKAVAPFREETQDLLKQLSETADVLDRWLKVQQMWCSLESVFMGGDISKQLPKEAKMFLKVDKEFAVQMERAQKTMFVAMMDKDTLDPAIAPDVYVVVRDLDLHYHAPIRPECDVKLILSVRKVRAAGLTVDFEFRSADLSVLHAKASRTVCRMDGVTHQPSAWSDEFRGKHEALIRA